jgi:hypothetical protein
MVGWEHAIGNYHLQEDHFLSDLVAALEFQITHCEVYRFLCTRQDFSPARDLRQGDDLARVPYITSNAFKISRKIYERLLTISPDAVSCWTSSSGTTGDRSLVGRTATEMAAYRRAYRAGFLQFAGTDAFDESLLFFPDPVQVIGRGARLRQGAIEPFGIFIGLEAGDVRESASRHYLPEWDGDRKQFAVNGPELFQRLRYLDAAAKIVYLGGAPAIMESILRHHRDTGETFSFGRRCKVQFGSGGWEVVQKLLGVSKERVKLEFVHRLCEVLKVNEPSSVDDSYGATETAGALMGHFSPFYGDFIFHQPPWMRVIVRNPQTLTPVTEPGERGLLELIMPYGAGSYAGVAILMDDVAELIRRNSCPECGRAGLSIRILGRAADAAGASPGCGAIIGN